MPTEPLVRLDHVDIKRGADEVLHDIRLTLSGGVVALLGPNGSGKSTLLQTIATILPASFGYVHVVGEDIGRWRAADRARRHIGYLAQATTAFDHLTVVEACTYAAWLRLVPRRQRTDAVRDVIELLSLDDVAGRRLNQLSGGTRRRAHLATALVHRPAVLLLDEPTAGLDADHCAELRDAIHALATDRLVLFSTHLVDDLTPAVSRVIYLGDRGVRFDGSPDDLAKLGAATTTRSDLAAGLQSLESR